MYKEQKKKASKSFYKKKKNFKKEIWQKLI